MCQKVEHERQNELKERIKRKRMSVNEMRKTSKKKKPKQIQKKEQVEKGH